MSQTIAIPTVTTTQGAIPQIPVALNAALIAIATSLAPGLTANLPGSLIEDMASTATGALVLLDQAQVDAINSLTPFGANPFTAIALGQIYLGQGSTAAPASNTSVFVTFSGTVGFIIPPGFIVSDGTNQYSVQNGGVIESGGSSAQIFCLCTQPGSFAVPVNGVTQIATSVPSGVTLSVTNPLPGTPGGPAQTTAQYAAQVLQAGLVASTGMPNYLKTLLGKVTGVEPRLVSVRAQSGGGWEIIVGGSADPYAVAAAIFFGLFDVSTLVGSTIRVVDITAANPGVVITDLNHGFVTGDVVTISGVNPGTYDGTYTITVFTNTSFGLGVDTTGFGAYVSGGVVTPNFRNVAPSLNSYPNTYIIPFVIPPLQNVAITLTWNTNSLNYISPAGVAQLGQPAIASYINSIPVGAPINVFELENVFTQAIAAIVSSVLITRMIFEVFINGTLTAPGSGTEAVSGDPESYFSTSAAEITINQG